MSWLIVNERDSRQAKTLQYLSLILVLFGIGYFFFRQFSQLQQLQNSYQAQIAQLHELRQVLADFPGFQNQQQRDQIKVDQIVSLLATQNQATQVAMSLSNQLVESGLQIKIFQPKTNQPKTELINFQAYGSYRQLINFFQANVGHWPLNIIEELNIVPETVTSSRLLVSGVFKICGFVDQSAADTSC